MKLILQYIKPYWRRVATGMSVKLLGTLMDLLIPYILAYIIDTVTPMGDMLSRTAEIEAAGENWRMEA